MELKGEEKELDSLEKPQRTLVSSFKYLGAIMSDEGSKREVVARIAQTADALEKLKPIWKDKNISLDYGTRHLSLQYAIETWTLKLPTRIQSMEIRCYRRLMGNCYTQHVTNQQKTSQAIGTRKVR